MAALGFYKREKTAKCLIENRIHMYTIIRISINLFIYVYI